MTPFNLQRAMAGETLCTRVGKPVKFLEHRPQNGNYPVLVGYDSGYKYHVSLSGRLLIDDEMSRDVFMTGVVEPKPSKPKWIFEESHGQHGHRCSVCTDWINYDCGQTSCRCGHASPYNPLRDRIKFLESVITAYEELSAKQSNLVNLLRK